MPTLPAHADISALQTVAHRIADGADQLLMQAWGKAMAPESVMEKIDGTLVTQTDHAVDDFVTRQLTEAYPDHAILSEERNTFYDPEAEFTWVIDPLDGTTNFARGLAIWGVSLALLWQGQPVLGLLSFPSLREKYLTSRAGGATLNGTAIHTSPNAAVDDQHFLMLCTRTPRHYRVNTPLKSRILGSAAYHIAAVANGSALAGIEATPKLWDIAAALLILTEAGGTYRSLAPETTIFPIPAYSKEYARASFPILVAANSHILSELESNIASA